MFRPVSLKLNAPLLEEQTLNFWKLRRIFSKSAERNTGGVEFVFYEPPLDLSQRPALGRLRVSAFQDVFLRYRLMRGYHVTRRGGWSSLSSHPVAGIADPGKVAGPSPVAGLGAAAGGSAVAGIADPGKIAGVGAVTGIADTGYSGEEAHLAFEFLPEWERFYDRIAFWSDMQDAYVTFTNDYVESLWWALKTLWDRGLLYQSYQVVPYCPHCATPLSDYEAGLGQREAVEPSAYVRLPLVDEPGTSLLAWADKPWTLPGSVAVAAQPEAEYVVVERPLPEGGRERLILARPCLEGVFGEGYVRVLDSFKGRKLKGRRYRPLFTYLQPGGLAHSVVMLPGLNLSQGSGLLPLAPAFDAQALLVSHEQDLPPLAVMDENGVFSLQARPWSGRFVKDAEPYILQDLQARGLLHHLKDVVHTVRFCWRCHAPLLDFACNAWYLRASQQKERLLRLNQNIRWQPARVKNAQFGAMLEGSGDWLISRRYLWGAPLPIWECESCHHQVLVASLEDLARLAGHPLSGLDLHPPHVDGVFLVCSECKGRMQRVPEVLDAWFEAGAMPAAQWHFPSENRDLFRSHFPSDLVCEETGRGLGWFYALHTLSALLFDSAAFKNAICLAPLLYAEGQEAPAARSSDAALWNLLTAQGADALRWRTCTAASPSEEPHLTSALVGQAGQAFIRPLWDVYGFFVACANRQCWQPSTTIVNASSQADILDRWLRSELHALVRWVTEALDDYDVTGATCAVQAFVEDLSGWYLPRARSRLWYGGSALMEADLGEDRADANHIYAVLYETLVTLSRLLAPFTPFLAEALYQNLVRSVDEGAPESVHLCDWPAYDPALIIETLPDEMRLVRRLAALGQAARRQASIRESQPLAEAILATGELKDSHSLELYAPLLADALNVSRVRFGEVSEAEALVDQPAWASACEGASLVALATGLTPDLVSSGLAGEFIRRLQELRQQAECEITEPIRVYVTATPPLLEAIQAHGDEIRAETLALEVEFAAPPAEALTLEAWFDAQWMKTGIIRVEPAAA